jgi:hypothetical protein
MEPPDSDLGRRRWQRLDALFNRALALPPEHRRDYLARECGDGAPLLASAARLYASVAQHGLMQ